MPRAAKKEVEETEHLTEVTEVTEEQAVLVPIKTTRIDSRKEDFKKLLDSLASELPAELIKTRRQGGAELSYLEWFTVCDQLDEKVGDWECYISDMRVVGDNLITRVALTIDGITRENVGIENLSTDSYGDIASNSFSMALKRAAALFGVGRFLYHKDTPEGGSEPESRSEGKPASTKATPAKAEPARTDGKYNARLLGMKKLGDYDVMEIEVPDFKPKLKWPINQFFGTDFDYGDLMTAVGFEKGDKFPFPCVVGDVDKNAKGYWTIGSYFPAEKVKTAIAASDTAPSSTNVGEESDEIPF